MLGDIPFPRLLGMAAGLLILGIGAFVLVARPRSRLHQLFFALAAADGVSTFAFDLAQSPVAESVRLHAFLVYYYGFIAFVALLAVFGFAFPRQLLGARMGRFAGWGALGLAVGTAVLHGIDHTAFWTAERAGGGLSFLVQTGGQVVNTAFVGATAFIIIRMTLAMIREGSASHRRQGALVLGGMALGYAPFATTTVFAGVAQGIDRTFLTTDPAVLLVYWASLITLLGILGAGVILIRERRRDRRADRNIVLSCLGGVLLLTLAFVLDASAATADLLQIVGLTAYPVLLAYAIVRFEVLEIDAHLRRAATVSLMGAAFTTSFVLLEVLIENLLQQVVPTQAASNFVAALLAAGITAVISVPLSRNLRKIAAKMVPTPPPDSIDSRRRDIYRHALEGAALDGVIEPHEMKVLARLRESLSISDMDHESMMSEISGRLTAA